MLVRAGQSKAGQDPQRSHRGNCKKRILHAWYTTYLSGMLVTVSAICAPARTERLSLCTVKRNSRGSENRSLTDALEQQEAGPSRPGVNRTGCRPVLQPFVSRLPLADAASACAFGPCGRHGSLP